MIFSVTLTSAGDLTTKLKLALAALQRPWVAPTSFHFVFGVFNIGSSALVHVA